MGRPTKGPEHNLLGLFLSPGKHYFFIFYFSFSAENGGSFYFLLFFGPKKKWTFSVLLFFRPKKENPFTVGL